VFDSPAAIISYLATYILPATSYLAPAWPSSGAKGLASFPSRGVAMSARREP
jgi:hypothetical protein